MQRFEQRLERLVEGSFGKAFKSGLQPVEIGRKVTRELDAHRQMGVHGVPVIPNNIGVYLSPDDFDRFESFADALARELAELVREHARDEGYQFVGSVTVHLVPDDELRVGECDVVSEIAAGTRVGSVLLSDGRRVALGEATLTIGRLPGNDVLVADPKASRKHAEIRPAGNGFMLVDLQSTNGTRVNGTNVGEHILVDGDRIAIGATEFRFEAS
jgi:nucleotide-binding universal stress UspA family protein